MNEHRSVRQWQELYRAGGLDYSDYSTRERLGWRSWEYPAKTLADRTKQLSQVVMGITSPYILDNFCVSFRRLPTRFRKLYDEVGFCALREDDDDKTFLVTLNNPHHRRKWSLFTGRYGEDAPEFDCWDVRELLEYIVQISPELERNIKSPIVAEKRAASAYARIFHGESGEFAIYRDGDRRYSFRARRDGREHIMMVASDLNDAPPGFLPEQAVFIRGQYVYSPDPRFPIPQKTENKSFKRKEIER